MMNRMYVVYVLCLSSLDSVNQPTEILNVSDIIHA